MIVTRAGVWNRPCRLGLPPRLSFWRHASEQDGEVARLSFRPLADSDLPHLADWLSASHVKQWWCDPTDLDRLRSKYLPRINGQDPTEVFVIVHGLQDIGIIQRYRLNSQPGWVGTLTKSGLRLANAAGIDYLIGESKQVGRGIGTQAVREFVDQLLADYPDVNQVAVTPQRANRASCRVLEKAHFEPRWTGHLDSNDPADEGTAVLYVRDR